MAVAMSVRLVLVFMFSLPVVHDDAGHSVPPTHCRPRLGRPAQHRYERRARPRQAEDTLQTPYTERSVTTEDTGMRNRPLATTSDGPRTTTSISMNKPSSAYFLRRGNPPAPTAAGTSST